MILYLATILQIENAIKLNPLQDIKLIDMQFPDKVFYKSLLYTLAPNNKFQITLHFILQNYLKLPIACFALGIMRMLSILKNPINPIPMLLNLIKSFPKELLSQDANIALLFNYIYFKFKKYDVLPWLYPCLVGVSFVYDSKFLFQYMKSNLFEIFNCEKYLLEKIDKEKFDEFFKSCSTLQEDGESENDKDVNVIVSHLNKAKNDCLIHVEQQNFRWCDLFYFILHLHKPFMYATYSFPSVTKNKQVFIWNHSI